MAEAVVLEPTVGSILSCAGGACGLSQGGSSGDDGQSLLPVGGRAGFFEFCTILYHFVPFWGVGSRRGRVGGFGAGAAFGHDTSRASVAGLDWVRRYGRNLTCIYDMGNLWGWARGEMSVDLGCGLGPSTSSGQALREPQGERNAATPGSPFDFPRGERNTAPPGSPFESLRASGTRLPPVHPSISLGANGTRLAPVGPSRASGRTVAGSPRFTLREPQGER